MEVMYTLWQGLQIAVTPEYLLWAFAGCIVGTAMGVLPGFGPSVAIALLLPLSFHVDITALFIFFFSVASGGMFGGSKASILLNIPGESASEVTKLEGHRMALNGRAGVALATAAIGSCVGGLLAGVCVLGVLPWAAWLAQKIGPAERFILMVMAFGAVSIGVGKSTLRGMTALLIGIALAWVGYESSSHVQRWGDYFPAFVDGVEMVIVATGVFVVAEVLHAALFDQEGGCKLAARGTLCMSRMDWKRSWRSWLRGAIIGTPFGCVPVGGIDMPTYVSYATERYVAPEASQKQFGREGAIEGVAGPEAANNATVTAALIPLLIMGIPTSNTTAMMVVAFRNYGIDLGTPLLTTGHLLVWVLLASLLISNLMLLLLNWPLARMWGWLLRIPKAHRYAAMLMLATASVYGLRQNVWDLCWLYGFGLLGLVMRRLDFPLTPMVIGLALAPAAEQQLRQALAISNGNFAVFFTQPLTLGLVLMVVLLIALPRVFQSWARRKIQSAKEAALNEGL